MELTEAILKRRSIRKYKAGFAISDEEMKDRLAHFAWEFPGSDYPRYLRMFSKTIGSMAKGGIWEV